VASGHAPNDARYAARGALLHVIAERLNWFDKYVKNAGAKSTTDARLDRRLAASIGSFCSVPVLARASELAGRTITAEEAGRPVQVTSAVPSAIDRLVRPRADALGMFTAQILMGLLLSVGYNPIRQWPAPAWIKLFTVHNWLGYIGLATVATHALLLLLAPSKSGGSLFRLVDILVPLWSPVHRSDHARRDRVLPRRLRRADVVLPAPVRPPSLEAAPLHGVRRGGGLLRARRVGGSAACRTAGGLD